MPVPLLFDALAWVVESLFRFGLYDPIFAFCWLKYGTKAVGSTLFGLSGGNAPKGSRGVATPEDRTERMFRGELSSSEGSCWNRPEVDVQGSLVAEAEVGSDLVRENLGMDELKTS